KVLSKTITSSTSKRFLQYLISIFQVINMGSPLPLNKTNTQELKGIPREYNHFFNCWLVSGVRENSENLTTDLKFPFAKGSQGPPVSIWAASEKSKMNLPASLFKNKICSRWVSGRLSKSAALPKTVHPSGLSSVKFLMLLMLITRYY